MMQTCKTTVSMLLGFLLAGALIAPASWAQEKVFFSVNGATTSPNYREAPCSFPTDTLDIAGSYTLSAGKTIDITAIAGGTAHVTCEESTDTLYLRNATIKTSTAVGTVVRIAFGRKFIAPPSPPADYSVSADGNFGNNSNGSWISLRGYVDADVLGDLTNPPPNSPNCMMQLTRCATTNPASWPFNSQAFSTIENISPADPRTLKSEFWFKLAGAAHSLNFSAAKGIQVKFGPPPGPKPCDDKGFACPEGQQCRGECPVCPDCLLPKWCLWVILGLAVVVFIFAVAYSKKSK